MNIKLQKSTINEKSSVKITGSKSESNRLLILQDLFQNIKITNVSNSDDSQLMQKALKIASSISTLNPISTEVDIHHAGTAMRFLTAYFAIKEGAEVVLTGSKRMKERPIKILVDALKKLGADIQYVQNEGFPPLKIKGKKLTKNKVTLKANVSSQYISALLLIASKLEQGLELTLDGKITSVPYINMTLSLLAQVGIETHFENNIITVQPNTQDPKPKTLSVESDWSSASYWYSIVALAPLNTQVSLSTYKKESLQGDAVLADIYKHFGVKTTFENESIIIQKSTTSNLQSPIQFDLANAPDIAQTIAVTAFGLGLQCDLKGLHTLKIKETDRLVALKNELSKFGAEINITDESLHLKPHTIFSKTNKNPTHLERLGVAIEEASIETYNDHRMAMAFAPLALKTSFIIEDAEVVSKSYPTFWKDLKSVGLNCKVLS